MKEVSIMATTLLSVSIALLAGLLMTRLFKRLKLPSVTAYLIAGVLVGPHCLGMLHQDGVGFTSHEGMEGLALISEVALGFIAFSIGNEFRISDLKKTGKQATVIGIFQALVATLFVDLALYGMHLLMPEILPLPTVLILGAIATATAPAATLMVVRQYKAKGPLTKLLLPIVALDDAVGLIIFAVSFGIARAMASGNVDLISILVNPIIEIAASLLLGALMGWILTFLEKLFNSNTNRLNLTIAFVFLTVSLAMIDFHIGAVHVQFSSLLVCMMLGTIFCNICPLSHDLMERSDKWTSPLFALFFVISGAELDLEILKNGFVVLVGVVYILARSAGKYLGTLGSAKMVRCEPQICKYLGITLLPQAGVALGMCTIAAATPELGESGEIIRNITLFAVLIYELVGPVLTRMSLQAAGEISPIPDHVKNRRHHKLNEAQELRGE